jgi:hypothetical protein
MNWYIAWEREKSHTDIARKAPELHHCWRCSEMEKPASMNEVDLPSLEKFSRTIHGLDGVRQIQDLKVFTLIRLNADRCGCWFRCGHRSCLEIWKEFRSCLESGQCTKNHVIDCEELKRIGKRSDLESDIRLPRNAEELRLELQQMYVGNQLPSIWRGRVPVR